MRQDYSCSQCLWPDLLAYYSSAQVLVERCHRWTLSGQSATGRVEIHQNSAVIVKKTVVQQLLGNHGQDSDTAAGQYLPTLLHNSAPNLSGSLSRASPIRRCLGLQVCSVVGPFQRLHLLRIKLGLIWMNDLVYCSTGRWIFSSLFQYLLGFFSRTDMALNVIDFFGT